MRSRAWQVGAAIVVWAYVALLHWRNDGLWYPGDSSTHASNGIFWWDFLTRLPHDPLQFALGYYARYPVINPTAYPPLFYLIEGALYRVFGISPYVPRAMVLACMLMGSLYLVAWIRRWIGEEAGWIGVLFALQPAIVIWGNAIMLNLPSAVMAMAALYHTRRWLEDLRARHIYAAGAFGVSAILLYTPSVVVVGLILGFVISERKLRVLLTRNAVIVAGIAGVVLLPWVIITLKWAPGHRRVAFLMGGRPFWELASWFYYVQVLPRMVSIPVLALAALALVFACTRKRWRPELRFVLLWFAICYVWFSFISVKEVRYALLLVPPCLILAATAAAALFEALRSRPSAIRRAAGVALAAIVLLHIPLAYAVRVPRIAGISQVAAFVSGAAPHEFVFYAGDYDNIFTYYLRAGDAHFSRGVVRSSKLLYATRIEPRFGLLEHINSSADVLMALRQGCGCRYLVVERELTNQIAAEQYLREALLGDEFRIVRSFQVETPAVHNIDIYEFRDGGNRPQTMEFAFPVLDDGVTYRVRPIQE